MFVGITNTPRPYAWGSTTAIAELLGREPSGQPEAELWLGAHPGSPSVILDPSLTGGAPDLAAWIAADPQAALGPFAASGRLPFLLKILAAASPLSLQAHPTAAQARSGFARENALGVPLDAAHRNYKDAYPKPELIYALSPTFDALCGFRPLAEVRALVLGLLDAALALEDPQPQPIEDLLDSLSTGLRETFEWLISSGPGVPTLVALVSQLAETLPSLAVARALAAEYPGDPGIVISLLVNSVTLKAGDALYLPAGNIHAYLSGLGVELMAASDNVLRGGLTPKHIDVPELLGVLDFTPVPVPYLAASRPAPGISVYRPGVPDFLLVRVDGSPVDATLSLAGPVLGGPALAGPSIAICTRGSLKIEGAHSSTTLPRGSAVYVTPDEGELHFSGDGTVFLATTGA
jgi:mannose-6-phosphate isomerase